MCAPRPYTKSWVLLIDNESRKDPAGAWTRLADGKTLCPSDAASEVPSTSATVCDQALHEKICEVLDSQVFYACEPPAVLVRNILEDSL